MARVLIVEDDKSSWDVLSRLLRHQNFEVDIATQAHEALSFVRQKEYDLAIIDLALPGMDGWQLLSQLRADDATKSLRSIALTAFHDPHVAREARRAGFLECYPKPANKELINDIRAYIEE